MSVERKWLAHYIDASFGVGETRNYTRLGKDLEELSIELNPTTETKVNILGENSTRVSGYEVSYSVDTFYAEPGDALFEHLLGIVDSRATGEQLLSTVIDVYITPTIGEGGAVTYAVTSAFKEDVIVTPTSFGGDTTGVQIPFEVRYNGNRVDYSSHVSVGADGTITIS